MRWSIGSCISHGVDRCRGAGIPDEVECATEVQMARQTLARAFAAGVPAGWVAMDEAYGQSKSLRVLMEEHDQPHVVATRRNDDVVTTGMGFARVDEFVASLPGRHGSGFPLVPGRTDCASICGHGADPCVLAG